MKIKTRLFELCNRNSSSNYLNKRLYRLLYSEDLYVMAYENIKSNTGILTMGVSSYNMDGVSMDRIKKLIKSLQDESYQPKPCRRVLIPKTNGKFRPLGIPDANDKLVQEAVKILLECIYDSSKGATFSKYSFGFRRELGCHDALKCVHDEFKKCAWLIKADVKGFFDNVNHQVLISLLRKRINDEKFLRLIWKFLRAGIMEKGQFHKTFKGTPQGGIVSPILANIYLHEFDMYVEKLKQEKGTEMQVNPEYSRIRVRRRTYEQKLKNYPADAKETVQLKEKINELKEKMFSLPSRVLKDSSKGRIKYVRYADDWMIAIKGSKSYATEIRDLCHKFYKEQLRLEWNEEKSKLIRSTEEDTEFLGTMLHFKSKREMRWINFVIHGVKCKKRSVGLNSLVLNLPKKMVLKRLANKGFLEYKQGEYKPRRMVRFLPLSDYEIVLRYNSIVRGIGNYYSFCNNPNELAHIYYLMRMSLARTLGNKHKIKGRKIWKKYGKHLTATRADGKKTVSFTPIKNFKRTVRNFKTKTVKTDYAAEFLTWGVRSKSFLRNYGCAICNSRKKIEVHHVKHIKKAEVRYSGFSKVMGYINRKQIPVCKKCHWDIHLGKYDGVTLKELANQIAIKLGIKKFRS